VALSAVSLLPSGVWLRPNPALTPWIFTTPLTASAIALVALAATSLASFRPGSALLHIQRVLIFFVVAGVVWTGFVFSVQLAWGIPDWFKGMFGAGLLALIGATRWAFSQLGDISKRFESGFGSTTIGKWIRLVLPQILYGVLGYAVLLMTIVVLYVIVDQLLPDWARLPLVVFFVALTVLGLTNHRLSRILNASSLHSFYRHRLGDCYIEREVDDAVEAGTTVDVPLGTVQAAGREKGDVRGPCHIIGAAINISGSTDINFLGRRADAFFLSPLYSGSSITGFTRTHSAYPDLTLADAMAISGSAFSPNQGSATSTSLAILLTLLNARLGYWMRNPAYFDGQNHQELSDSAPLLLYWKEMLGRASSTDRSIYLSDGGHFDNSGIYELVRRRCRYIIAIDGSGEPTPESPVFSSLGVVCRLVRIDFGVDIRLDLQALIPAASGRTTAYYAIGEVIYPRMHEGESEDDRRGIIVYVKSTLTQTQTSPDLEFYKRLTTIFPNHSTVDQFFDEGQFESYRALGYEAGRAVFRDPLTVPPGTSDPERTQRLCDLWNKGLREQSVETPQV
jgi:hypothetical protein